MHEAGSSFDVVSGGELYRVQQAGADLGRVVFAGVGKTDDEIRFALESNILMFNVESEAELDAISQGRRVDEPPRARGPAPQSRHRRQDARENHDRKTRQQVRNGYRTGLGARRQGRRATPHLTLSESTCTWARRSFRPSRMRRPSQKAARVVADFRRSGHEIGWINLGRRLRHQLPPAGRAAGRRLRQGDRPRRAGGELPAGAGAGPIHRRQRRRARQPGHLHQARRGQDVHHPGRGNERPGPPGDVRLRFTASGRPGRALAARRTISRGSFPAASRPTLSARSASRPISWPRTAGFRASSAASTSSRSAPGPTERR